jgi:hypothetical protein
MSASDEAVEFQTDADRTLFSTVSDALLPNLDDAEVDEKLEKLYLKIKRECARGRADPKRITGWLDGREQRIAARLDWNKAYDATSTGTRVEIIPSAKRGVTKLKASSGWFSQRASQLEFATEEYTVEVSVNVRPGFRTTDESSSVEAPILELELWDRSTFISSALLASPAGQFVDEEGLLKSDHPLVRAVRRVQARPRVEFAQDLAVTAAGLTAIWVSPLLFGLKWLSRVASGTGRRYHRDGSFAGPAILWQGQSAVDGHDVWVIRDPFSDVSHPKDIVQWRLKALEHAGVVESSIVDGVLADFGRTIACLEGSFFVNFLEKFSIVYLSLPSTTALMLETNGHKLEPAVIAALVTAGMELL